MSSASNTGLSLLCLPRHTNFLFLGLVSKSRIRQLRYFLHNQHAWFSNTRLFSRYSRDKSPSHTSLFFLPIGRQDALAYHTCSSSPRSTKFSFLSEKLLLPPLAHHTSLFLLRPTRHACLPYNPVSTSGSNECLFATTTKRICKTKSRS
jgi:hypothetical protein